MTLYKKAVLALVAMLAAVLAATLVSVFDESREYIEDELFVKAQNTASVLGVSMSQVEGDTVRMSVMADAVFDTGFYRKIEMKSMKGKPLFQKSLQSVTSGAPGWFVSLFEISVPKGVAQVSDGWKPVGILEVESNISLAYEYLYELFKRLLFIFFFAVVMGSLLIVWVLRLLLKPLEAVGKQAAEVLKNRFVINEEIPNTKELRAVTKAVNALVKKMKEMYGELVEITERNRRLEYRDSSTQLCNRKYFFMKYDSCKPSVGGRSGSVALFRVCGMEEANDTIGYDKVNMIIRVLAKRLVDIFSDLERSTVCRLSGKEFAVLLPESDIGDAARLSSEFLEKGIETLYEYPEVSKTLSLRAAVARYEEDLSKLLSSFDIALNGAEGKEPLVIETEEMKRGALPVRKEEWRELFERALRENLFEISPKKIYSVDKELVCVEPSFHLPFYDGGSIDKKVYLPLVYKLGFSERYNRFRFDALLLDERVEGSKVVLEFTYDYIDSIHGFEMVAEYSKRLKKKGAELVVEIRQHELAKRDYSAVKVLFEKISSHSIGVSIGGFDADPSVLRLLKVVGPLFVRMKESHYRNSAQALQDSTFLLLKSAGSALVLESDEPLRI